MDKNYKKAKEINHLALCIYNESKNLKNDIRFGHDGDVKLEAEEILMLASNIRDAILELDLN